MQKLNKVILLREPGELTESERVLFDVLFRDTLGNVEASSYRDTFKLGDGKHNEARIDKMISFTKKSEGDDDLIQMMAMMALQIEDLTL